MNQSKRKNRERRAFGKTVPFPLTDRNGCVVPFNRSYHADRRLNNLQLREVQVDLSEQ